jgi:hypothetical protein
MTLNEALAVKARGLTKERIIAHLRGVAENNLRADIRTIERAWKEKPSGLEGKTVKQSRNTGTVPFDRLSAVDCRNEQDHPDEGRTGRTAISLTADWADNAQQNVRPKALHCDGPHLPRVTL